MIQLRRFLEALPAALHRPELAWSLKYRALHSKLLERHSEYRAATLKGSTESAIWPLVGGPGRVLGSARINEPAMTDAAENTPVVTAAALIIGDEILSGRTKDRNIGTLADRLTDIGIVLREVRIVPDDESEIVAAVNALRSRYDYLFTTGGIGPTHDDITADSIAAALGVPIDVDPRALALMQAYYDERRMELTPARRRMARVPQGAVLIENSISVAPGFMIGNVIVLAGVPSIMEVMLDATLKVLRKGTRILSASIDVDRPESEIASVFASHQAEYADVRMGSYPSLRNGKPVTQLVLRSTDENRLKIATLSLKEKLAKLF
jgi:molybdenum cofactor synthesis domain-containing protein